jgi:hypothetical protein
MAGYYFLLKSVKMKKTIRIFIFFLFNILLSMELVVGQIQGQVYVERSDELLSKIRLSRNIAGIEKMTYADIKGDPFLYKDFTEGKLILNTGEIFKLDMRYDIYANQIQFKDNNEIFELLNADRLSGIIIDTLVFRYCYFLTSPGDESSAEPSFFIVKTDGKCSLLIRKNIRLQPAVLPQAYKEAQPAEFIHTSDMYYLKLQDKGAVRVSNKKELLNLLSDKKTEVEKFMNSKRLGVRNLDDLAKIVVYYNTL